MKINKKRITVVHAQSVIDYPPVISLIENLLNNGNVVRLISYDTNKLPDTLRKNKNFYEISIPKVDGNLVGKVINSYRRSAFVKEAVKQSMKNSDILWTTTDLSVRVLGDLVLQYKHVMQLMELIRWYPDNFYVRKIAKFGLFRYPIDKYARKAWKVVIPEENRAYIQQVWWNLKNKPYILPNKPYRLNPKGGKNQAFIEAINKIKHEERKVILYLGILSPERGLDKFAKSVHELGNDYCLYIIGKASDSSYLSKVKNLTKIYNNVVYLGYFSAPTHLYFLKYSYIGLLPYQPSKPSVEFISELNALYCAPNKIFEYAGYALPMIGTNVPGIEYPFRNYHMGITLKEITTKEIVSAVHTIEKDYDTFSKNSKTFFESVNLDKIVDEIVN